MKPIKLYESLFIFHKCHLTLQEVGQILHTIDRSNKSFDRLHLSWTNLIIMESVSFIDEYEQNFHFRCETEYKNRVLLTRKICEPVIRKVKEWKDLKDFRNHIIAHPWRDKDKNLVIPDLNKYSIPRNSFEHVVLVNLMGYIFDLIKSVFPSEMNEMFIYMQTLIPRDKEKISYHNLTNEHLDMAIKVNQISKDEGHNYELKIMGYKFD